MSEMHETEATTIEPRARVLLVLSQDVVDRARVFAGKATTTLKLPVSLQSVLRALIEEGLKRDHHAALLANVEDQARAVRRKRSQARRARADAEEGTLRPARSRGSSGHAPRKGRGAAPVGHHDDRR